ncbi:ABC transporter substrate-binding protein [Salicibibacter cibarius]|uniref:ABC transporter substrate-binding protein n=1 Tax=Salicibibacter cibarius TaxID=2743000 RepID=A0A7T6Z164_9BACI|nr:ABC transporter substrate-binding protein [Salicibibacter cibarius]QQK75039.1 ABC transporter substrate-binding protein [Salicibibacter cibarius]
MKVTRSLGMTSILLCGIGLAACGGESEDNGSLTVYTAFPEQEAVSYLEAFEEETGIDVNFVRLSGGQILARMQSEEGNPQASVWYGGATEELINASNEGLLEAYEPESASVIPEEHTDDDWMWTPVSLAAVGFASNEDWLAQSGVDAPESWEDLLDESFSDNVSIAHPAASGTAYTVLATLVQLMGEDEAFDYLAELNENIRQYTDTGPAPANNAGLGEVGTGIAMTHDIFAPISEGYPIEISYPEDGTAYEEVGVALINGAPEEEKENAKELIDWTVSKEAQNLIAEHNRLPLDSNAEIPDDAVPLDELNTIDYDGEKAAEMRGELIDRFEEEIVGEGAALD